MKFVTVTPALAVPELDPHFCWKRLEAKERIADTINRSDGLFFSPGPAPGAFPYSLPASNISQRESKESEERVGRNWNLSW